MEMSTLSKALVEQLLKLSEESQKILTDMYRCGDLKALLNFRIEKPEMFRYLLQKAVQEQSYDLHMNYIRKQ